MGRAISARSLVVLCAFVVQMWPATAPAQTPPAQTPATCRAPLQLAGIRPGADGEPTEVVIGVYLVDLIDIGDAEQIFSADALLSVSWRDPRLVDEALGASLANCRVPLDAIWNPHLLVVNERDVKKRWSDVAVVGPGGTVRYSQRFIGDFSMPLDLRDFPFDEQTIELEFVAMQGRPNDVVFVLDQERPGIAELVSIRDWSVGESGYDLEPLYISLQDDYRSKIRFSVGVKRNSGYYLWKIFFPLSMIVFMSWAVFYMKPTIVPAQMSVSTSAVLTLIAFLFSLGEIMPRLSYLTRSDRFVVGSMLLVFMAFGEALVTTSLVRETLALRIDRVSRFVFPAVFVVVVLFTLVI